MSFLWKLPQQRAKVCNQGNLSESFGGKFPTKHTYSSLPDSDILLRLLESIEKKAGECWMKRTSGGYESLCPISGDLPMCYSKKIVFCQFSLRTLSLNKRRTDQLGKLVFAKQKEYFYFKVIISSVKYFFSEKLFATSSFLLSQS